MQLASLTRAVRLGVSSLALHKLRAFLTTLGVLFGVSSVIAMLAVAEGASVEAQEQIRQLGSENVILRSVAPPTDKVSNQESRILAYGLTHEDLARIRDTFPGVKRTIGILQVPEEVRQGSAVCSPRVLCVPPSYLAATGREMFQGRFFVPADGAQYDPVCVLGYEIARYLFPFESPLGKRVKVGADYFEVVGVVYPRVPISSLATDPSTEVGGEVFIPIGTGLKVFGDRQVTIRSGTVDIQEVELHEIIIQVDGGANVPFVADACRSMLTRNHQEKDFEVIVPLELLLRAEETKRIFSIVLGSIAGISLLVGGIGIMNVMLATVTERTREIGIRRALGAKRAHIVTQFLVETVVLSGCGGLAGVALGLAIPMGIERFSDMRTIVTPGAPLLAFGISVATGIIFGLYPAWRAAHMDPVEALRHE
ncbi:MAG: ABC transporter permease [Planctomycetota bacterium]|jgi:putative ABC transport system permease protein|nr:ABC transporter ATP-binding protein [Planctomycetota bacterium]MDP6369311.1 ABC transporter permease [Planctomycetota bacterium]MDP6838767.1 ABC transporter permease [Planctomycetota bacterium]MDP6954617.1 ABC transporter permease [Planctomycetota bacterium]